MLRANPRVLGTALFSALGLLPLACGGSSTGTHDESGGSGGSSAAGNTGSTGTCTEPQPLGNGYEQCGGNGPVHRPSVEECKSSLPRDSMKIAPPGDGQCQSDADCADMPHGYCTSGGQVPGTFCAYGCVKDSECGAGSICVCGEPVGRCVGSTCTSDTECGAGLRCQSYDQSHGCGILRFACQTARDTCQSDADCRGGFCDGASGVFTCVTGGCAIGRPFLVEGVERVAAVVARADWSDAPALELDGMEPELENRLAEAWLRVGQMEHASVAAFARFTLQLLQLGASPELVEAATAAMSDETRHAQQAFGVASQYARKQLGPAALDVGGSLGAVTLLEVVRLAVREGCIGETSAALEAREAAEHAAAPQLRQLLGTVADDETRHAELAFRFVAWALEQAPDEVTGVVLHELEQARPRSVVPSTPAGELTLLAHGVLPEGMRTRVRAAAYRQVIEPCVLALVARSRPVPLEKPILSA
jgi:hypothetical protein